jgi:hypothetical protein
MANSLHLLLGDINVRGNSIIVSHKVIWYKEVN